MRTYGRTYDEYGNPTWVEIQTDQNGFNDYVYTTALIQVLKLNLGESPFWATYGIPAKPSLVQQVAPDYYTMITQQQFAQYFANLNVTRITTYTAKGAPVPTYRVNVITHTGVQIEAQIPV